MREKHDVHATALQDAARYPVWAVVDYNGLKPVMNADKLVAGAAVYTDNSMDGQGLPDSKLVLSERGDIGQPLGFFGTIRKVGKVYRDRTGRVSADCEIEVYYE